MVGQGGGEPFDVQVAAWDDDNVIWTGEVWRSGLAVRWRRAYSYIGEDAIAPAPDASNADCIAVAGHGTQGSDQDHLFVEIYGDVCQRHLGQGGCVASDQAHRDFQAAVAADLLPEYGQFLGWGRWWLVGRWLGCATTDHQQTDEKIMAFVAQRSVHDRRMIP